MSAAGAPANGSSAAPRPAPRPAPRTAAGRTRKGHCLCGAVRFEYHGPEIWRGHCHCESCRRQAASPVTTFMGVADGRWRWTGIQPAVYRSSPGRERFFCPRCGAPAAFRDEGQPGEIHFYAALLEDADDFAAERHFHADEALPWLQIADGLPRHHGTAAPDTDTETDPPAQHEDQTS